MEIKQKNKAGIIVAAAIIFVFLCAVGGSAAAMYYFANKPEVKIAEGIKNLGKEFLEVQNPVAAEFDSWKLREMLAKGKTSTEMKLNISGIKEMGTTIGMDMNIEYDYPDEKMRSVVSASVANVPLLETEVGAEADDIYFSIPKLFNGSVVFSGKDLDGQYSGSVLEEKLGPVDLKGLEIDFFPTYEETEDVDNNTLGLEFYHALQEEIEAVKNTVTIEKSKETFDVVRKEKVETCKGYLVTLHAKEVNQVIAKTMQILERSLEKNVIEEKLMTVKEWRKVMEDANFSLAEDIPILIFMDKKNNIVRIETTEAVTFIEDPFTYSFSVDFKGTEAVSSDWESNIYYQSADSSGTINITRNTDTEEDTYHNRVVVAITEQEEDIQTLTYDNIWNIADKTFQLQLMVTRDEKTVGIEAEGQIGTVIEGEEYRLNLERLELLSNEERFVRLSGSVSVTALEDEIRMPDGAQHRIFEASKGELYGLTAEIYTNVLKYENTIQNVMEHLK